MFHSLCSGFVEPQNVVDYNEYRGKFNKMAKSRMFRTAVYCIEEHLRKPNVSNLSVVYFEAFYLLHSFILFSQTSLPRTSSGRTLRVKHEDYEYDINTTTNEISSSSSSQDQCTMCAQLLIELQQSRTAYNEIYSQNQKDTDNADIKQRELSKNVKELQTSCSRFDQQNVQLNAKVESLVAQTRQLESKCSQLNKENLGLRDELAEFKSTKLDKHYEVQKLLDDKMDKGEQHFLVEWKGYGAKYNSWEKRSALNCPRLLSQYMKKK